MLTLNIVYLPGDGIGPEVTAPVIKLLRNITQKGHLRFNITTIQCGGEYYFNHGEEWPEGSFEKCRSADAIFLGAVGHSVNNQLVMTRSKEEYTEPKMAGYAAVIGNRKKLDLFANVRPVKLYPGIYPHISGQPVSVWKSEEVDYVIIRENLEDAYTERNFKAATGHQTLIEISRKNTERIVRFAYDYVTKQNRQGVITCVDKSNIIGAHRLFREIFTRIGDTEYPQIQKHYAYVDSFCIKQIQSPQELEVVIAPNYVGDIISDNAAITQGGLGMAASANIGHHCAMFEPVHGSAPQLKGMNTANPMGAFLSAKMMFEWFYLKYSEPALLRIAAKLEQAIQETISQKILTADVSYQAKGYGLKAVGEAINSIFLSLSD